ncbi:Cmx/CmrA family chloramphenicol efflux MFS transporter [Pseudonocardia humida]|uniref:MFS transporter n=1 Tax=Pseudonocardia humida TaxID=2800819 RepID=A0ABT1A159_9PSEU|nr:Cmx/CmrA family chloramphenicol efflux MFS transporter [Pseudonocardia humida]MCO1656554.1 MFS transporter [Pseudonocardia humida]
MVEQERRGRDRVPAVVPVLALSIFAIGTSEFIIIGLLPEIATDLRVSIPQAGYLISAFALGMIVGAPVMAVLTLRLPRRITMIAALVVFAAGSFLAALADDYPLLLVARVVTAVATATFWVVSAVVTVSVVGPQDRARALSVLLAGLTLANIVGVPVGTFIGQLWGWRAAFWAVGAVAAIGLAGVLAMVREGTSGAPSSGLAAEFAVFRQGRLWLALGTIALHAAATIGVFSYVAPLLTDVAGIEARWVPLILLGNGIGCFVGITVGGRLADAHPWSVLFGSLVAMTVVIGLIGVLAAWPVPAVVLVVLLGVVSFLVAAPLNARVYELAGAAPTLASATTTSAFNVGNTVGPALGGLVISTGWGYAATAWVGVVLAVGAIAAGFTSWSLDARDARRARPGAAAARTP